MNETPATIQSAVELFEQGDDEGAARICQRLLSGMPNDVNPRILHSMILEKHLDHENAAQELHTSLRIQPRFEKDGFSNAFGLTYADLAERMKNNVLAAIERHAGSGEKEGMPAEWLFKISIADHILGNLDEARTQYQRCIELNCDPYMALTGLAFISQQAGDMDAYRELIDYSAFPVTYDLAEEKGSGEIGDLNQSVYDTVVNHPSLAPEVHPESPAAKSITDDFTAENAPEPVAAVIGLVTEKIEHLKESLTQKAGHPFLGRIPERYKIEMFGALLDAGGFHSPHVHTDSWISGGYYARIPLSDADDDDNARCLEFGKMLFNFGFEGERHYVEPREGLLAMWPSFYIHNTVPCLDARQRLTMGFNVYPLD
jgi:hypothetical protein